VSSSRVWTEMTKGVIARSLFFVPLHRNRMLQIVAEHRQIADALKRNDLRDARALLEKHLLGSERELRKARALQAETDGGSRSRRTVSNAAD
jgi:DNA-binding GntR family transcriptional regulator